MGEAQHISLKYWIYDVNWTDQALLRCSQGTINFIQWSVFIRKIWGQEVSPDCDIKAIKGARFPPPPFFISTCCFSTPLL